MDREAGAALPEGDAARRGGLACGIASVLRELRPEARVFASEIEGADPLRAALEARAPQAVDYRPSFVDGIGSKRVFPQMLARAQAVLCGSIPVPLADVAAAIRLIAERSRVIAEGAGASSLAAALTGAAGKGKIACVISGGNIDLAKLATILAGSMP